uniref:Uncharacterized protein n=1 Tax=Scophthalmus maximus TaxID=52904 RepID=A0A8D3D8S7_SCOMX
MREKGMNNQNMETIVLNMSGKKHTLCFRRPGPLSRGRRGKTLSSNRVIRELDSHSCSFVFFILFKSIKHLFLHYYMFFTFD